MKERLIENAQREVFGVGSLLLEGWLYLKYGFSHPLFINMWLDMCVEYVFSCGTLKGVDLLIC